MSERSETSGQYCLGKLSRDTGQSLVPDPPERITGTIPPTEEARCWVAVSASIGVTVFMPAPRAGSARL